MAPMTRCCRLPRANQANQANQVRSDEKRPRGLLPLLAPRVQSGSESPGSHRGTQLFHISRLCKDLAGEAVDCIIPGVRRLSPLHIHQLTFGGTVTPSPVIY